MPPLLYPTRHPESRPAGGLALNKVTHSDEVVRIPIDQLYHLHKGIGNRIELVVALIDSRSAFVKADRVAANQVIAEPDKVRIAIPRIFLPDPLHRPKGNHSPGPVTIFEAVDRLV